MHIDNVLVITPPEYIHSQALYDVAMSFSKSLPTNPGTGELPILTTDPQACEDGKTLVFGAHLVSKYGATIDGDYVIYQTEQLGAAESLFASDADQAYLDLLRRFPVWDYSVLNQNFLRDKGIDVTLVPITYNRCMSSIKTGRSASLTGPSAIKFCEWSGAIPPVDPTTGKYAQDIDVLFCGSMNERRMQIIQALKDSTLFDKPLVIAQFVGYGAYRDKYIARSKIVLNMHYYDTAIHEIFRTSHLYANKKCVVSELGRDASIEEKFWNTDGFVTYSNLVRTCLDLLADAPRREATASLQNSIFAATSQSAILKGVLSE